MTRQDLDLAIDWAAAEGWNPGLNDAECFQAADPAGFLMGRLGDEPIASISVVRYANSFGFLGLYIVRPEWRAVSAIASGRPAWPLSKIASWVSTVSWPSRRIPRLGLSDAPRALRRNSRSTALPNECLQRGAGIVEAVLAYDRPFLALPRIPALLAQARCAQRLCLRGGRNRQRLRRHPRLPERL